MSRRGRRAAKPHPALQFSGGSRHRPGIGATLDCRPLTLLRGISGKIGARFLEFLRRHAASKQEGASQHQPSRFPGGLQLGLRVKKEQTQIDGPVLGRSTENYIALNLGLDRKKAGNSCRYASATDIPSLPRRKSRRQFDPNQATYPQSGVSIKHSKRRL